MWDFKETSHKFCLQFDLPKRRSVVASNFDFFLIIKINLVNDFE